MQSTNVAQILQERMAWENKEFLIKSRCNSILAVRINRLLIGSISAAKRVLLWLPSGQSKAKCSMFTLGQIDAASAYSLADI